MSSESKRPLHAGLPFLLTMFVASLLQADPVMADVIISQVNSPATQGSCSPAVVTDNGGGEAKITKTINSIAPCDLQIKVTGLSPANPTVHFTETVTNGSKIPWRDFHFFLGYKLGALFEVSPDDDVLEFVHEGTDKPSAITSVQHSFVLTNVDEVAGPDTLGFATSQGLLPEGFVDFDFKVTLAEPGGEVTFTLRQTPTIPEPTSLALLALGLGGLGFSRCKRAS